MNNDLISRSELKHKFAQITYIRFTADMGQGGFEMFSEKEIEDIIDKVPTVTDRTEEVLSLQNTIAKLVEGIAENARPQGEWIDTGSGQECNVCHEIQYGYDNFRHFCANCGAKMGKGKAE